MGKSKSMGFGGMDEVWIRKTNGATAGVAIAHARMTLSQDHVRRLGQILEALVALGHTSVSSYTLQSLSNDIYTHGRTHHPGKTS